MGGNVADATLLGQTPLPMRSWFPPFAKCAKDGADLVIGGDSRSKAGASAIPPPHQDQNPRPVSAKNADTRTGHPPPKTDAGGKSQADAGGGGTGQGGRDAAGHDSVVGHRPGTRLRRSGRRGGGGGAEDASVPRASREELYSVGGSAAPFSESARRGAPRAPRVISVHVRDKPGLWFPVKVAGPVSSPDPTRRQLQNRIPYQLQPHSPILKRAGLVVAVTAHIQGEIETVLNGTALAEVTAPHAQLCGRGNLRCSPQ